MLTLGLLYYRGYQDYDRALEIFKYVQKARPNLPYTYLGYIQRRMGKWEESTANLEKSFQLNPLYPVSRDAYDGPQYIWNLAIIYTVIGEYEEAISQLEYLLSIHAGNLISVPLLRIDPMWELLRKHPRFQRLLKQN